MSQRGGAVQASLRIADGPIGSDLISHGGADLIIGMEPIEALRYLEYLAPGGSVVTAAGRICVPMRELIRVLLPRLNSPNTWHVPSRMNKADACSIRHTTLKRLLSARAQAGTALPRHRNR